MTSKYLERPIRPLADVLAEQQAAADLGLDPADYRAARGEADDCETCGGSGINPMGRNFAAILCGVVSPIKCRTCHGTGRQPERGATEAEAVKDLRENFPRGDEA